MMWTCPEGTDSYIFIGPYTSKLQEEIIINLADNYPRTDYTPRGRVVYMDLTQLKLT